LLFNLTAHKYIPRPLSLPLSVFPFEIVLIWNLNSAPGDRNKELQIKDGRKITALVNVKNALHSITKEKRSSIRWGFGRGGVISLEVVTARQRRDGAEILGLSGGGECGAW
jgi:hypothetical protein